MREFQDIFDSYNSWFPYCLLVALPIFIALSPMPVVSASTHDFPVHRLAQFEYSGTLVGSKAAAVSMDARSAKADASNLLRKVVVVRLLDVTSTSLETMISQGVGAIVLLLPNKQDTNTVHENRETLLQLEEHLLASEIEIPIYFAEDSESITQLLNDLDFGMGGVGQKTSAAQTLFNAIGSTGYQLVTASSGIPKQQHDPIVRNIEGTLRARGEDDSQPTIVVVAHYDTLGAAPSLSYGADSNGSGVIVLLELARMFSRLYKSSKTQPSVNLVFLLSAGGKFNYFGTKKWLESHLDSSSSSELLSDVKFCLCLDSIGNTQLSSKVEDKESVEHSSKNSRIETSKRENVLHMHVSKPPKEDSHSGRFFSSLAAISEKIGNESNIPESTNDVQVRYVHKKINLADEKLAWEHERFSIRRLPAFTLSNIESHDTLDRVPTILDRTVDTKQIAKNARIIAEALACTIFDYKETSCQGTMFQDSSSSHHVSEEHIQEWSDYLSTTPRFAGLLSTNKASEHNKVVKTLAEALKTFTYDVKVVDHKRDKREPEFNFYDLHQTTMNVYKVKPAVFDLILSLGIAGYLFVVYGLIIKSGVIYGFMSNLMQGYVKSSLNASNSKTNGAQNHAYTTLPGSPKINGHNGTNGTTKIKAF